jgi:hypothetical protein
MKFTIGHDASMCQYCVQKDNSILCKAKHEYLDEINIHKVSNVYKKGQAIFNEGTFPYGILLYKSW